ncbi:hypothetical protein CAC01_24295 [Streptomyces sp. CLI2509]|nr:hypothetical protein CAC01_24295 [Streptomyces sp. CLI2509]
MLLRRICCSVGGTRADALPRYHPPWPPGDCPAAPSLGPRSRFYGRGALTPGFPPAAPGVIFATRVPPGFHRPRVAPGRFSALLVPIHTCVSLPQVYGYGVGGPPRLHPGPPAPGRTGGGAAGGGRTVARGGRAAWPVAVRGMSIYRPTTVCAGLFRVRGGRNEEYRRPVRCCVCGKRYDEGDGGDRAHYARRSDGPR